MIHARESQILVRPGSKLPDQLVEGCRRVDFPPRYLIEQIMELFV
jgi:hypothetical protein